MISFLKGPLPCRCTSALGPGAHAAEKFPPSVHTHTYTKTMTCILLTQAGPCKAQYPQLGKTIALERVEHLFTPILSLVLVSSKWCHARKKKTLSQRWHHCHGYSMATAPQLATILCSAQYRDEYIASPLCSNQNKAYGRDD